jgi:protein-tyrosine-phosphatase
MTDPLNVLFLCTGNSARSILAEAILRRDGAGRFNAYSAGSQPKGEPHPLALAILHERGHDTGFARSKSWDEFGGTDAPDLDIVITVCDNAAAESCPVWPGGPLKAHWGIPDPAAATGTEAERRKAFAVAYDRMEARIRSLLALPFETADAASLARQLADIGAGEGATSLAGG